MAVMENMAVCVTGAERSRLNCELGHKDAACVFRTGARTKHLTLKRLVPPDVGVRKFFSQQTFLRPKDPTESGCQWVQTPHLAPAPDTQPHFHE